MRLPSGVRINPWGPCSLPPVKRDDVFLRVVLIVPIGVGQTPEATSFAPRVNVGIERIERTKKTLSSDKIDGELLNGSGSCSEVYAKEASVLITGDESAFRVDG